MVDTLLHLIVIATAICGLYRGYREGFTGQIISILGLSVGAVAANAFGDSATLWLYETMAHDDFSPSETFLYNLTGHTAVFGVAYIFFALVGKVLKSVMGYFGVDVLNGLAGSLFGAFKYLFVLSIVYNFAGGLFPDSKLMRYASSDDGNLVEIVTLIAPRVMGSLDCEDFHHLLQLRDAKTIS